MVSVCWSAVDNRRARFLTKCSMEYILRETSRVRYQICLKCYGGYFCCEALAGKSFSSMLQSANSILDSVLLLCATKRI
jgi:hypothetical protein